MKKIFLFSTALLCATSSYATFCPTNFNQISIGDSMEAVIAQCGAPTSKEIKEPEAPSQPQEWVYYVKMQAESTNTMRMTVAIVQDKVINITVSGMSIPSAQFCPNGTINLGDTPKIVKAVCGEPAMVNQTNNAPQVIGTQDKSKDDANKDTVFTYTVNGSSSKLTFAAGKLKSIN